MAVQIRVMRWSEELQQLVVIPLDDAEPEVIQLARKIHGRQMTIGQALPLIRKAFDVD